MTALTLRNWRSSTWKTLKMSLNVSMDLTLKQLLDLMPLLSLVCVYCRFSYVFSWKHSFLGFSLSLFFFVVVDTFIQKTKKLYQDTRTQRNIAKLNDELYEVHQIMTRNVQEVLGVGEKLDRKPYLLICSLIHYGF